MVTYHSFLMENIYMYMSFVSSFEETQKHVTCYESLCLAVYYKVVQIWPGQTVTCLHTNSPGHIWTTL
jgi:hypothetical protein